MESFQPLFLKQSTWTSYSNRVVAIYEWNATSIPCIKDVVAITNHHPLLHWSVRRFFFLKYCPLSMLHMGSQDGILFFHQPTVLSQLSTLKSQQPSNASLFNIIFGNEHVFLKNSILLGCFWQRIRVVFCIKYYIWEILSLGTSWFNITIIIQCEVIHKLRHLKLCSC